MQNLIPAADDSGEFVETAYDMSRAQAEKEFGADFALGAELNALEGADHE